MVTRSRLENIQYIAISLATLGGVLSGGSVGYTVGVINFADEYLQLALSAIGAIGVGAMSGLITLGLFRNTNRPLMDDVAMMFMRRRNFDVAQNEAWRGAPAA